jgi:hypothetical protein
MDPITAILDAITCLLQTLGYLLLWVMATFVNIIVLAISGWVRALVLLLPSMPPTLAAPPGAVLQWINWVFPVQPVLGIFTVIITIIVSMFLLRIAMRWVRIL